MKIRTLLTRLFSLISILFCSLALVSCGGMSINSVFDRINNITWETSSSTVEYSKFKYQYEYTYDNDSKNNYTKTVTLGKYVESEYTKYPGIYVEEKFKGISEEIIINKFLAINFGNDIRVYQQAIQNIDSIEINTLFVNDEGKLHIDNNIIPSDLIRRESKSITIEEYNIIIESLTHPNKIVIGETEYMSIYESNMVPSLEEQVLIESCDYNRVTRTTGIVFYQLNNDGTVNYNLQSRVVLGKSILISFEKFRIVTYEEYDLKLHTKMKYDFNFLTDSPEIPRPSTLGY